MYLQIKIQKAVILFLASCGCETL